MEDYMKESIDHSEGLPVDSDSDHRRLQSQCESLQSKLNQQILSTQSSKAEAKLNAQGLKKAIEKNQELSEQNSRLVEQYNKWKPALQAESRASRLENELKELTEDLDFFKDQYKSQKFCFSSMEEILVESVLSDLIGETEPSCVGDFLFQNMGNESCRRLIHLSNSLRPSTIRTLFLAAKIKAIQNDNQRLHILLSTAQGEAKLLTDEIGHLIEDKASGQGQHSTGKPPVSKSSAKLRDSTKRPWEPSSNSIQQD